MAKRDNPKLPDSVPPATEPRRRGDEPAPLTEDDIAALAGRRDKAATVVRRLTTHRSAAATGRLVSEKEAPAPITAKEMAAIRRSRRSTTTTRDRFQRSDTPAEVGSDPRDRKLRPDRSPK